MNSLPNRLWGVWLLMLLAAPTVMAVTGLHPNDLGQDTATASPGLDASRLLDLDYYHEIDDRAEQTLTLRDSGLWAKAAVDYLLFDDSTAPDLVTIGADGWLYWTEYLSIPCDELHDTRLPPTSSAEPQQVRFIITASKAELYPEPVDDLRPCEPGARDAWRTEVEADPRYIDVNTPLDRTRSDEPSADLFYRHDTHWTPDARLIVAQTIVDSIRPGCGTRPPRFPHQERPSSNVCSTPRSMPSTRPPIGVLITTIEASATHRLDNTSVARIVNTLTPPRDQG